MKRVSVITPFVDGSAPFLEEAIRSVLGQDYTNWELLLVNDGATGAFSRLAIRYAEAHPDQIRCLEPEGRVNRGASAARNLGIRHSDGAYVAFLDADDVWLPGKLTEQVALYAAVPEAGMLYGNSLYWHSWTGKPADAGRDFTPRLGVAPDRLMPPPALLPRFLTGRAAVPCTCSVILRRDVLERVGGWDESFRGMYDDQVLYVKMAIEAPVYVANACWDRYRQHPESMTSGAGAVAKEREARRSFLAWLERYLTERDVRDEALWRALREEVWFERHPRVGRGLKRARKLLWRVEDLLG